MASRVEPAVRSELCSVGFGPTDLGPEVGLYRLYAFRLRFRHDVLVEKLASTFGAAVPVDCLAEGVVG